jgi:putative nucleotidyltransferase with HDIG domain
MYQHQRMLTDDLRRLNAHLERANLSFAAGLVATLDARDEYTAGHSTAVAAYSRDIARELGLSHEEREQVFVAALVHDIGKIGLPAALLEKPGPLNLAERRRMQEHATIGERILRQVETYGDIARVVRHHHERFDGQGYPDGLRGDAIPQLSRIIAVADSYNAMTSNRPYRDAMDPAIARERLAAAAGSQFDPVIVEAFDAVLEAADEAYRRGRGPMFIRPIARQALPRQSELISSAA